LLRLRQISYWLFFWPADGLHIAASPASFRRQYRGLLPPPPIISPLVAFAIALLPIFAFSFFDLY